MDYFGDNKVNNFITKLPQTIELTGEWELGLVDIQFPVNWINMSDIQGKLLIKLFEENSDGHFYATDLVGVELQTGYYETGDDLVQALNYLIKKQKLAKRVNFKYDQFSSKVSVNIKNALVVASAWLCEMLGFTDITLNPKNTGVLEYSAQDVQAAFPVDMKRGINSLYVYTDIIQDRIVGDSLVPLLRSVPAEGKHGSINCKEMLRVHYMPIQKKTFHTIHIYITDDTGTLVPFQGGRSVVTLHFRRKSLVTT